jgi:outer membrane biogenesis lipoprotein LolB
MKVLLLPVCIMLLTACSESGKDQADNGKQLDDQHFLSSQTEALDRARDVEQDMLDAAQRQREQIESESD